MTFDLSVFSLSHTHVISIILPIYLFIYNQQGSMTSHLKKSTGFQVCSLYFYFLALYLVMS